MKQENEILEVIYMSRKDFERINENPPNNSICISIRSRYDIPVMLSDKWDTGLKLCFDANLKATDLHGFSDEMADNTIKFALDNIKPTTEKLIIHCGEGKVRSPAIAMEIANMYYAQCNICKGYDENTFWTMRRAHRRLLGMN